MADAVCITEGCDRRGGLEVNGRRNALRICVSSELVDCAARSYCHALRFLMNRFSAVSLPIQLEVEYA